MINKFKQIEKNWGVLNDYVYGKMYEWKTDFNFSYCFEHPLKYALKWKIYGNGKWEVIWETDYVK